MHTTTRFGDDATIVQRLLDHIDHGTTDVGESSWREPVANYRSEARLVAERALLRNHPIPFCPAAALPEAGSYLARNAGGTPLLVVRGGDGVVRGFRNACRHRGTELASGAGCRKAFVCRYHGWTYGLDGALRHVPHEHGFPGLDKATRGLVPVTTVETHGLVFVTQEGEAAPALDGLPVLVPDAYRLIDTAEGEVAANWKIFTEGFLEGYHIRSTHPQTFYPLQYDNLNVVEACGPHRRIAFPYRAIEKLRTRPAEARSADGVLTYVTHLFPTALVATFPGRILMVVLEPLAIDRTWQVAFTLSNEPPDDDRAQEFMARGTTLVDAGAAEDREMAMAIQRSLASEANEFLEFGRFESAIVHFHRTLAAAIGERR